MTLFWCEIFEPMRDYVEMRANLEEKKREYD